MWVPGVLPWHFQIAMLENLLSGKALHVWEANSDRDQNPLTPP